MSSAAEGSRGRKPKPPSLRRTEWLKARANPLELEAAKARAQMAGLNLSDYLRRQVCGAEPEASVRPAPMQTTEPEPPVQSYEALVARHAVRMPRRNAEFLARKELAGL